MAYLRFAGRKVSFILEKKSFFNATLRRFLLYFFRFVAVYP
ncbi:hypothetical protein NBRC111894_3041 [Sporolactobacillus inulinus]|uniref:Uncharacterized protein n=1 Tax=Sporolactobacillus inulinus TaxID=2078 RepID=A0A4Y1ZEE9_9BACL|nr:hypothetical protein NBRC111894_3041 [Sporolactobacillus inulinus]